jgi:hypothetical protein
VYVEEPNNSLKKAADEYRTWAIGQPKFVHDDSSSENEKPVNES